MWCIPSLLSPGAIAGIVLAVLILLVGAVVVVIVIGICAMRQTKKAGEAEVCVDCAPESGSLLRGRDSPDAAPIQLDDSQVTTSVCSALCLVRDGIMLHLLYMHLLSRRTVRGFGGGRVSDTFSYGHHDAYMYVYLRKLFTQSYV